jgi:hypothetical protein
LDIVLELFADQIESFAAEFPPPDFYPSVPAVREAVRHADQFNVIHFASGYKVDFMLARRDEWGREQLHRRMRVPILSDLDAYAASAEDVILGKLWYFDEGGSDKHLRDIAGMLRMTEADLDRGYIERWADALGYRAAWDAVVEREQAD